MAAPDMDVIKDIPGYKVILKAVLKSQIQQLVEQLASHTDEESIILTASVSDGTLSHLGSDSGKHFLEDNEDVKSQFLGHCLKYHHKRKQEKEREKQQQEQQQQQLQQQMASQQYGMRPNFMRSPRQQFPPRYPSPRNAGPIRSPLGSGVRHSPYPVTRPMRVPRPNFDAGPRGGMPLRPLGDQVIKIEPDDDSNQSDSNPQPSSAQSSSQPGSPSQPSTSTSAVKAESSDKDDDAHSESSSSTIPLSDRKFTDGVPPEGLSLDSDLSGLISGDQSQSGTPSTSQGQSGGSDSIDPNVSVKLEAITDAEMELEITGVEPGTRPVMPSGSQDWSQQGTMGYDPMGAAGNQSDMQAGDQGYNALFENYQQFLVTKAIKRSQYSQGVTDTNRSSPDIDVPMTSSSSSSFMPSTQNPSTSRSQADHFHGNEDRLSSGRLQLVCEYCGKTFRDNWKKNDHVRKHTGEKPFKCALCQKQYTRAQTLKGHMLHAHFEEFSKGDMDI